MKVDKHLLRKTSLNLKLSATLEQMYDHYYDNDEFDRYLRVAMRLVKKGANINITNSSNETLSRMVAQKFADVNPLNISRTYSFDYAFKQIEKYGDALSYLICNGCLKDEEKSGVHIEDYVKQACPSGHKIGLLGLIERSKEIDKKIKDATK